MDGSVDGYRVDLVHSVHYMAAWPTEEDSVATLEPHTHGRVVLTVLEDWLG